MTGYRDVSFMIACCLALTTRHSAGKEEQLLWIIITDLLCGSRSKAFIFKHQRMDSCIRKASPTNGDCLFLFGINRGPWVACLTIEMLGVHTCLLCCFVKSTDTVFIIVDQTDTTTNLDVVRITVFQLDLLCSLPLFQPE